MTPQQSYTLKEMLTRMSEEAKEDRSQTDKKIDEISLNLKEFRHESIESDEEQDKRIGILENWQNFVMGAVWLCTGSGALTGLYFLVSWLADTRTP